MKDLYKGALFGSFGSIIASIVFGQGFENGKEAVLTIGGNILISAVAGGIIFYLLGKFRKKT